MTMLSAIDAFFVAYQESSGVLMQLGVEVELKGPITRDDVERMLSHIVKRWPPLGQRLRRDWLGLSWEGKPQTREMLSVAENRDKLAEWRNRAVESVSRATVSSSLDRGWCSESFGVSRTSCGC